MSADILFYCRQRGETALSPEIPADVEIAVWRPAVDGAPTGMFATKANLAWWLGDRFGMFPRRDLAVVVVYRGGTLLHRLLVTRKWFRFPFMGPRDLQMGMLWTAPEGRGKGLARAAIAAVHDRFDGTYEKMWYVVSADNAPSRALIEQFGYREAGRGKRTAPLGISLLGRFVIDHPAR